MTFILVVMLQSMDVGIKEEWGFYLARLKIWTLMSDSIKKKKKGSYLWVSKADFNTFHREPKERMEEKVVRPVNHMQSWLKPGIKCPFPYNIRN